MNRAGKRVSAVTGFPTSKNIFSILAGVKKHRKRTTLFVSIVNL